MTSKRCLLFSVCFLFAGCGDDDGPMDSGTFDGAIVDASADVLLRDSGGTNEDAAIDVCEGVPEAQRCSETACEGDTLAICEANAAGCRVRREVDCEASNATCDADSRTCSGMCGEPECDAPGVSCEGDTLVTCAADARGCRREERSECAIGCAATPDAACIAPSGCMPLDDAVVIGCDSEPISGSTLTGTSAFDNYCGSRLEHFGREQIYAFRDPRVARATVRVTRGFGDRDMDLFVLDDSTTCESTSCVVSDRGREDEKVVTFNSYPDGTSYISYDLRDDVPSANGAVYQLSVECEFSTCGDSIVEGGEECDDGGNVSDDGCSEYCELEAGFFCRNGNCAREFAAGEGVLEDTDTPWTRPTVDCEEGEVDTVFDTIPYTNTSAETQHIAFYSSSVNDFQNVLYLYRSAPDDVRPVDGCEEGDRRVATFFDARVGVAEVAAGETVYVVISSNESDGRGRYTYSFYDSTSGCGNGVREEIPYLEGCDDGNTMPGDGCSAVCQAEDGFVCPRGPGPSMCRATTCGDGRTEGSEMCDDANTVGGDGCTDCVVDENYYCRNLFAGSVCVLEICGNGEVEGRELCDDGNTVGGDACEADCASAIMRGSLEASDPLWSRPTSACEGGAPGFHYDVATFDWRGDFEIVGLTWTVEWTDVDGYLHVFEDEFDASTPLVGCLDGDDDYGGRDGSQVLERVEIGETQQAVLSTYEPGTTGDWVLTVTRSPSGFGP